MHWAGQRFAVLAFAGTALFPTFSPAEADPSFDCRKASSKTEKAICANAGLARIDSEMADVYGQALAAVGEAGAAKLKASQRNWIKGLAECGAKVACLEKRYRTRMADLNEIAGQAPAVADLPYLDPRTASLSCDERVARAKTYAEGVSIAIRLFEDGPEDTIPAEGNVAILAEARWTPPKSALPPLPTFLVLDAQPEARFGIPGEPKKPPGFIPLNAGARGLMDIARAKERTRVFFPLHRDLSPASLFDGSQGVDIWPKRAGPEQIGWAIVTAGECGEQVLAEGSSRPFAVPIRRVEVVTQDQYAEARPRITVRDSSGRHDLLVFDGRYEIRDAGTGSLVMARQGNDPSFSPTGRFVAHVRPADQIPEIVDLVTGEVIADLSLGHVVWVRNDSYVLLAGLEYGTFTYLPTLVDGDGKGTTLQLNGCTTCWPWVHDEVSLDLDRGFLAVLGMDNNSITRDLATGTEVDDKFAEGLESAPREAARSKLEAKLVSMFGPGALVAHRPDWREKEARLSAWRGDGEAWHHGWEVNEPIRVTQGDREPDAALTNGIVFAVDRMPPSQSASKDKYLRATTVASRGLAIINDEDRSLQRLQQGAAAVPIDEVLRRIEAVIGGLTPAGPVVEREYPNGWAATWPLFEKEVAALVEDLKELDPAVASMLGTNESGCDQGKYPDPGPLFMNGAIAKSWSWTGKSGETRIVQTDCTMGTGHMNGGDLWLFREGHAALSLLPLLTSEDMPEGDSPLGWRAIGEQGVGIYPTTDNLVLVASPGGGVGAVIDLATGKRFGRLLRIKDGNLIISMRLTADRRHVVQLNRDGRFRVYAIDEGFDRADEEPPELLGAHVDDEIVVMDSQGRFDATYEGAQSLQIKIAGYAGMPSIHQFAAKLRRPGLAKEILAYKPQFDLQESDRAGRYNPFDDGSYLLAPPVAALELSAAIEDGRRSGRVSLTSSHADNEIRLYVDGRLAQTLPANGRSAAVDFTLDDPGGARWVTALAVDKDGVTSLPSSVHLPSPATPRGALRAVAVGINAYHADPAIPPLELAASDARRFTDALATSKGRAAGAVETKLILDGEATRQSVVDAVAAAAEATGPDDTLVVFFAGHGVDGGAFDGKKGELVLALPTTRTADLSGTALPWSALTEAIGRSRGTVVVVLDVCQAGLAGSEAFATNDDAAAALLTASGTPVVVLASSKGRQVSRESPAAGGGVFTAALASAIGANRTADRDGNGIIDLGELYRSVRTEVMAETDGAQTPWLARNALVGEMALF